MIFFCCLPSSPRLVLPECPLLFFLHCLRRTDMLEHHAAWGWGFSTLCFHVHAQSRQEKNQGRVRVFRFHLVLTLGAFGGHQTVTLRWKVSSAATLIAALHRRRRGLNPSKAFSLIRKPRPNCSNEQVNHLAKAWQTSNNQHSLTAFFFIFCVSSNANLDLISQSWKTPN